jgi:hypothetical protein
MLRCTQDQPCRRKRHDRGRIVVSTKVRVALQHLTFVAETGGTFDLQQIGEWGKNTLVCRWNWRAFNLRLAFSPLMRNGR